MEDTIRSGYVKGSKWRARRLWSYRGQAPSRPSVFRLQVLEYFLHYLDLKLFPIIRTYYISKTEFWCWIEVVLRNLNTIYLVCLLSSNKIQYLLLYNKTTVDILFWPAMQVRHVTQYIVNTPINLLTTIITLVQIKTLHTFRMSETIDLITKPFPNFAYLHLYR